VTTAHFPRWRLYAWLLLAAVLLHNVEEGLTYPLARGRAADVLAQLGVASSPSPQQFWTALVVVSLLAGAALIWAQAGRSSAGKLLILRATAAVLLTNVLIPHVPAAIALGGYAPGLASALLINLPLSLVVLTKLRRE
jgi:hypothetical protein